MLLSKKKKKKDWKQSRQLNLLSALLLCDVELVFESRSVEDIKVITV